MVSEPLLMKAARFALWIVLLCSFLANANASAPVWMTQAQAPKTPSLLFKHPRKQAIDLCREYKRKEIAGNVLMPIGACALGGGTYMIYKGSRNVVSQYNHAVYDYHTQPTSRHDVGLICGGSALFIAGVALAPGGFIMASVARVKYCKYCRAGGAMYFTPSQTGAGWLLIFRQPKDLLRCTEGWAKFKDSFNIYKLIY